MSEAKLSSDDLLKFKREAEELTGWPCEIHSISEIEEWQRSEISSIMNKAEEDSHKVDMLVKKYTE